MNERNLPPILIGLILLVVAICILLIVVFPPNFSKLAPQTPNTSELQRLTAEYHTNLERIQKQYNEMVVSFYILGYMDKAKDKSYNLLTRLNEYPEFKRVAIDSNFRMLTQIEKDSLIKLK